MPAETNYLLKYTNPVADQPLFQILFIDQNVGYVVGGSKNCNGTGCTPPGGLVLKTTDGGETWTSVYQMPGDTEFDAIAVNNSGDLFLIANSFTGPSQYTGEIWKSTNGGVDWTLVESTDFPLSKITFNNTFGFCTGGYGGGKIIRSNDNGNTWSHTTSLGELWTYDIAFSNNIGYCIADNISAYKTIDNGDNWTRVYYPSDNYSSFRLSPLTANSCLLWGSGAYSGGCFGSTNGAVRQTTDAGNDWSDNQFKDTGGIRCISFYSAVEGYFIAGGNGVNLIKVMVK